MVESGVVEVQDERVILDSCTESFSIGVEDTLGKGTVTIRSALFSLSKYFQFPSRSHWKPIR